ncbi:MAG TPA: hypothetical protein VOA41_15295 [Candidatus Dormibacteraeota bacterium]|nr:hypothetical protein [Candidatus Dormibacteraeota bacterium]
MKKFRATLMVALIAASAVWAGQSKSKKSDAGKHSAKVTNASVKHEEHTGKRAYVELLISELNAEDPARWSERMQTHASVSGFITNVAKGEDGDLNVRICENPKVEGMDRNHCFLAKCIPEIPCVLPPVGKPITVKGITRYDAKAGAHWWEIHPVEQIEK